VDTYFKGPTHSEQVEHYSHPNLHLDPHSCGSYDADIPVWDPREYFLRALSARMDQVTQEWNNTVEQLTPQIEAFVTTEIFPIITVLSDFHTRYIPSPGRTQPSIEMMKLALLNKRALNGQFEFFDSSAIFCRRPLLLGIHL